MIWRKKISVRVNLSFFHRVVWKLQKFSLTLFLQKFVKASVLLKKLLDRWFDEKKFSVRRENFSFLHTVLHSALWSLRNFCITIFWKKSVKTTSLVKSFTVKLISRNNSQVIQIFHKFHTVNCESTVSHCGNCSFLYFWHPL